ncbi:hypothetical protein HYU22_01285 [Candidatus Woesearchaeota archaeon]|nr:hypothetical protein [Candidatus Woesearchaeota archaeon]
MGLVELQYWVNIIVSWSHLILVGAAIYFLWLIFKGGTEGTSHKDAWGIGSKTGRALWEKGSKAYKASKKFKNIVLGEFVDLEELKKEINDAGIKDDAALKKAVGSSERKAKRQESRAFRRFSKLQKAVKDDTNVTDEKKAKAEEILKEMEIFNNTIVKKIKEFDTVLSRKGGISFPEKKRQLNRILDEAIEAEQDLVAEHQKLMKL